jgi:hypothetical protein
MAEQAKKQPKQTRLDSDNTKPSTTAPGDGPADTTDPTERATTVGGDKRAAAEAGHLTVNAVLPLPKADAPERDSKNDRTEKYDVLDPSGNKVTVTHNLETGETSVS